MDYTKAFETLMRDEGLWVLTCDPNDPGGETWSGISRVAWPDWKGWPLIDKAKSSPSSVDTKHESYPEIKRLTEAFYKEKFWTPFGCDQLPDGLAYEIFEQAVNLGTSRTVRHLQRVLNALNRPCASGGLEYGDDLTVDGKYGEKTRSRLLAAVSNRRAEAILNGINGLQCAYYIELGEGSKVRRTYTNGWLSKRGKGALA